MLDFAMRLSYLIPSVIHTLDFHELALDVERDKDQDSHLLGDLP